MTIYERMQIEAEAIVPGVDLKKLLRANTTGKVRSESSKQDIRTLLLSGNMYLTSSWLSQYHRISLRELNYIRDYAPRERTKNLIL